MAKGRYSVCGTLCMCFCIIVFIGFCDADVNNLKDRCFYKTDVIQQSDRQIDIEFLQDEDMHVIRKRDTEIHPSNSRTSGISSLTEKVIPLRARRNGSQSMTDPVLEHQIHNLGVNGTGQRQNTTARRNELPDLIHGLPSSVNTPVKLTTQNGDEDEDAEILPNKLTPEEVAVGDEIDKKDLENNNITDLKRDTHIFYNSTMYNDPKIGQQFWVNVDAHADGKRNDLLSNSHRRAATVKLTFEFPFYGRYIKNVTVATGGFLYMGNYVHSWLAATQYIAPLMANFDTRSSNLSMVKYIDNGTAFTVTWERVALQDKPDFAFTFQTTLHKNGDILFVYKDVPLPIEDINEVHHPVKVGLSDAYILDRTVFYVRRKTIFEYHRVTFKKEEIRNWTAIYLKALPTCLDLLNCSSCLNNDLNLNCTWCPSLHQCSTGQDRNRQYWLDNNCEKDNVTLEYNCILYDDSTSTVRQNDSLNYDVYSSKVDDVYIGKIGIQRHKELGTSGYVAILFLVTMIIGFIIWTTYAYRNPQTTSGQILIRVRGLACCCFTRPYRLLRAMGAFVRGDIAHR